MTAPLREALARIRAQQAARKAHLDSLNPTPRSPNGSHRQPSPQAHGNSAVRTSLPAGAWRAFPQTVALDTSALTYDPFKPKPIPYAGIRAGELTGHRGWLVTKDYQLRSLAHHFIWEPSATIEGDINEVLDPRWSFWGPPLMGGVYCHFTAEQTHKDCLEGLEPDTFPKEVYAGDKSKMEAMLLAYRGISAPTIKVIGVAVGTIKLWGEVVEHEQGYRAQFAKLTSLYYATDLVDLSRLKAKYVP